MKPSSIPIPGHWPKRVKSAILHVISLAHWSLIHSRSWAANSPIQRVRLAGQLDQARNEITLLREELRIKDSRMARIPAHHRPFYPPTERMAILELRAARGWNLDQTARAFLVESATISSWMKRLDEEGEQDLVRLPTPVNKYPAFVAHITRRLKVLCPAMGKQRMAQTLARAGIALSATSVARFLNQPPPPSKSMSPPGLPFDTSRRTVMANYPNHVWHVDLTTVPTRAGFWIPWLPLAMLQCWPFCWWVAVVLDQFTRRVIGFQIFKSQPTSRQITMFINGRTRAIGQAPKHIISDKGSQFWCLPFKRWCQRRNIRPRFGAIGRYGSISVIERLIRSMKSECTRRIMAPLAQSAMLRELDYYTEWFNAYRPHQGLGGLVPLDQFDPEKRKTPTDNRRRRNSNLQPFILDVAYFKERQHLPMIRLESAA